MTSKLASILATLRQVVVGHAACCLVVGLLYGLGLGWLFGPIVGVGIGVAAGLARLLPLVDVLVVFVSSLGFILISTVMFAEGWPVVGDWLSASYSLGQVVGVIIAINLLDNFVITPKLMGSSVGLPGRVVFLGTLIFSITLGIWGALIAVPVLAVSKVLFGEAFDRWAHDKPGLKYFYRLGKTSRYDGDVGLGPGSDERPEASVSTDREGQGEASQ